MTRQETATTGRSAREVEAARGERALTIAFAVSLGFHLSLVVAQLVSLEWLLPQRPRQPLNVVYDFDVAEIERREQMDRIERIKRDSLPSSAGLDPAARTQIRVPSQPSLALSQTVAELMPGRPTIVDLTNLVDAARGDPVLLSYFSAVREQIQRTANRRAWVTGQYQHGLVYVSFVLAASGGVSDVAVVADRSVRSAELQEIGVRIVRAAAPFPPFPPSMQEPSKTLLVPLEFLLGAETGG
jgi:protein TonB